MSFALKRLVRLRYGDALAVDDRNEAGAVQVYGSGGPHGRHDQANTSGPVIVVGRKGSVGALHWSDEPVWVSDTAYAIDGLDRAGNLRFVYYMLASANLGLLSQDVGVPGLSRDRVHELRCVIENPEDQRVIADFLDCECARIDELVKETEHVDGLRAEAYERFLREEVGADLHEWVQVRRVATTGTGHTPSRKHPEWWVADECEIPWFTLSDVWQIRNDEVEHVGETAELISPAGVANSSAVLHPAGTVLLSRTASVGFSAVMATDMAVSQDFMTWTCGPRLMPNFLLYALRAIRPELRSLMDGSTHKTIYMPDLHALKIPLPSRETQEEAVVRIRQRLGSQWQFRNETTGLRRHLHEYREALITEAVTGRLDVTATSQSRMSDNLAAVREGADPEVLA